MHAFLQSLAQLTLDSRFVEMAKTAGFEARIAALVAYPIWVTATQALVAAAVFCLMAGLRTAPENGRTRRVVLFSAGATGLALAAVLNVFLAPLVAHDWREIAVLCALPALTVLCLMAGLRARESAKKRYGLLIVGSCLGLFMLVVAVLGSVDTVKSRRSQIKTLITEKNEAAAMGLIENSALSQSLPLPSDMENATRTAKKLGLRVGGSFTLDKPYIVWKVTENSDKNSPIYKYDKEFSKIIHFSDMYKYLGSDLHNVRTIAVAYRLTTGQGQNMVITGGAGRLQNVTRYGVNIYYYDRESGQCKGIELLEDDPLKQYGNSPWSTGNSHTSDADIQEAVAKRMR